MKRSYSEVRPENLKLVSVSPYRAIVKIENQDSVDREEEEEELQRAEYEEGEKPRTTLSERRQRSPIKADSEYLRNQRDRFLRTFSEKRGSGQEQDS